MQTLDAIFLDKLELKFTKKPVLWTKKIGGGIEQVKLISISPNEMVFEEAGFKYKVRRKEDEQDLIWPSKDDRNWNNWRQYLFEDRIDFIAPNSYIFQSKDHHIHLSETVSTLPYLIIDKSIGSVMNAKGGFLKVDLNKYRYATQHEIDRFLYFASISGVVLNQDKKTYKWDYWYLMNIKDKPKFMPGEIVAIRDTITGEIFEGFYIIKYVKYDKGKYLYQLQLDINYSSMESCCFLDEDLLVKLNIDYERKNKIENIIPENKIEVGENKEEDYLL